MTQAPTRIMTDEADGFAVLRGGGIHIVISAKRGDRLRILYAGPAIHEATPTGLQRLAQREHAPGGPETPIEASWLNAIGTGHPSPPGLLAHSEGQHWALDPRVESAEITGERSAKIVARDAASGLQFEHSVVVHQSTGVTEFATTVMNEGGRPVSLDWCAAVCLPLDERLSQATSFAGRWAGEFQTEKIELVRGSFVRENRAGRTSHASYPGIYLGAQQTSEGIGPACAFHLGWSGNSRIEIDRLPDGQLAVQGGEILQPGEIVLQPGSKYTTPSFVASWSDHGHGDVTRRLHRYVHNRSPRPRRPRPVHFNSWEAVYFDHSEGRLRALADAAAEVGAERFVVDDGWFGARRSDRAGLGDWQVSDAVYPDGLKPLADHVRALGMEFGLWFEPEMVNPDSDLYRAHPDWVLQAEGADAIASRHQFALDLTRPEVTHYLFERIDALVHELGIAYIKWDMNRDIQHPGGADGKAVMHRQVRALYDLIDRIRMAHPELEIESCSSGGARADYGILARADRIWTSDNNDARARYAIMRGAAHFLPLSLLGNHVGPESCHITGRRFDMAFRAGTAVFGHMGMELDLADESAADRQTVADAIALHKQHRHVIHHGAYYRPETPRNIAGVGVVTEDRSEALFQISILDEHPTTQPPRARFAGLEENQIYRLDCVWPAAQATTVGQFSGAALMHYGMQLPRTNPDTCLIYHLASAA